MGQENRKQAEEIIKRLEQATPHILAAKVLAESHKGDPTLVSRLQSAATTVVDITNDVKGKLDPSKG
jgi:hypothetical protein